MGILLLYVNSAFYINIQHWYLLVIPDAVQLIFQSAIIFTFIYHFPFHKFILLYFMLECLCADKIIINAVPFSGPGGTGGCRNRKSQLRKLF